MISQIKANNILCCHFFKVTFTACMLVALISGCEDFVDIDPPKTRVVREEVFTNDATANAAMSAIYANMFINGGAGLTSSLNRNNGLLADELIDFTGTSEFATSSITATNTEVFGYWAELYNYIYASNAIIEGLANSTVTPALKDQLLGEAKFIRALCHFYTVNLWGDSPLITTSDFRINASISRSNRTSVYNQILQDLIEAQGLLAADYSFSNGERARPNKSAATALLARVYLYVEDWDNAEVQSSTIINNPDFSLVADLNKISLVNNSEAIWQIKSTATTGTNTFDAVYYLLSGPPTVVALSNALTSSFELGDKRRTTWIGEITVGSTTYFYANKYKVPATGSLPITEAVSMLRLAEQFLIRAEARAHRGNIAGAVDDVNVIRTRAGLPNIIATDQALVLTAILQERRVELFTEGSHRWFDLKRTGKANETLSQIKGSWQSTDSLYPIPQKDRDKNSNLSQNAGY